MKNSRTDIQMCTRNPSLGSVLILIFRYEYIFWVVYLAPSSSLVSSRTLYFSQFSFYQQCVRMHLHNPIHTRTDSPIEWFSHACIIRKTIAYIFNWYYRIFRSILLCCWIVSVCVCECACGKCLNWYATLHTERAMYVWCVSHLYIDSCSECATICTCVVLIVLAIAKISTIYSRLLQIMHLFVAMILTNDDLFVFSASSASSSSSLSSPSANESHANQSTTKSPTNTKFNLHTFLKEKLLEPYIQKIYGKCTKCRLEWNVY